MSEQIIGIIGHANHVKTLFISENIGMSVVIDKKTIQEIIEDQKSIPFHAPKEIPLKEWNFKGGRELRRERRKKKRKNKK